MRVMNKFMAGVAFAAALLAGAAVPLSGAQAVSLLNGSFESASVDPGGSFVPLFNGDTSITGWTVSGTNIGSWPAGVYYIGGLWAASDGSRSLDLNEYAPGGISQNVPGFIIGNLYKVSFDIAGNTGGGPTIKTLDVSISSPSGSYSFNFDTTGFAYETNIGWAPRSFTFTATSTAELLAFISTTTGDSGNEAAPYAFGPALDNVVITDLGQTPLPAALPLFAAGLGAMGLLGWRRKRKNAAALAAA